MAYDEESFLQGLISGGTLKYCNNYTGHRETLAFILHVREASAYKTRHLIADDLFIDWGDGSTEYHETWNYHWSGELVHNYTRDGDFTLVLNGTIKRIEIGVNYTSLGGRHTIVSVLTRAPSSLETLGLILAVSDGLRSIRQDFFADCILGARSGILIMSETRSLETVPKNIFKNFRNVEDFAGCFRNSGIIRIPDSLFYNCTSCKRLSSAFANCKNLEYVPDNIFDNCPVEILNLCFTGDDNLTHLPELWNKFPNAEHRECFRGCTAADNYADCPDDWK